VNEVAPIGLGGKGHRQTALSQAVGGKLGVGRGRESAQTQAGRQRRNRGRTGIPGGKDHLADSGDSDGVYRRADGSGYLERVRRGRE
tara:strand:- start:909 stop:1169 length:261 start_codon:yes stop_codon:yes gene_type:complete